jgi:hypothetical protein
MVHGRLVLTKPRGGVWLAMHRYGAESAPPAERSRATSRQVVYEDDRRVILVS